MALFFSLAIFQNGTFAIATHAHVMHHAHLKSLLLPQGKAPETSRIKPMSAIILENRYDERSFHLQFLRESALETHSIDDEIWRSYLRLFTARLQASEVRI